MDIFVKILYALPVYQSVVLAVFLFLSGHRLQSNSRLLMALFQFLMAFYFSFNLLYSIHAYQALGIIYFFILPVILLFIPIFYLYIVSITTTTFKWNKTYLYNFLPTILIALLNLPFLFASDSDRLNFISHGYNIKSSSPLFTYLLSIYMAGILGIFTLQLIIYSLKALKLYKNHKTNIENSYSYTENINLDWIMALIICFVIFFVFNDILYLIGFRQQIAIQIIYNLAMLTTTLYIGYRGLIQIELHKKEIIINSQRVLPPPSLPEASPFIEIGVQSQTADTAVQQTEPNTLRTNQSRKYSGSSLTDEQKSQLLTKLHHAIIVEKIYRNPQLSIEDVAHTLVSNSKYISQIINETYNQNFYNFINFHRINEAKLLLASHDNERYSILGIAQSVGFVSKSTFNTAFRRFTDTTPSQFKTTNSSPT